MYILAKTINCYKRKKTPLLLDPSVKIFLGSYLRRDGHWKVSAESKYLERGNIFFPIKKTRSKRSIRDHNWYISIVKLLIKLPRNDKINTSKCVASVVFFKALFFALVHHFKKRKKLFKLKARKVGFLTAWIFHGQLTFKKQYTAIRSKNEQFWKLIPFFHVQSRYLVKIAQFATDRILALDHLNECFYALISGF